MNIVADELVKEPPKTIDAQKEDERQVGAVNEDKGTDDITKDVVKVDQTVVKEVEPPKEEKKEEPKPEPKPEKEEVFRSAAHMPSFPGGDAALMSFINKNIKYPQVAQDNGVQGKVIVQFVVEKDGRVGEVKVARGVDKDLDREAVRVCKMLPKFSPGRNAVGDPVRVWYTLPVTFKLQGVN
jgi:protein TonB